MMSATKIKFHPAAGIFPLLEGDEFKDLTEDIKVRGLLEPIYLHPEDGSIIDGRNRYRACLDANIEPRTRIWNGAGSLIEFIVSLNLKRRHLNASQRACVATEMLPFLEKEARSRMSAGGRSKGTELIPDLGESRQKAARTANVNEHYVTDAKSLKDNHPAAYESIRAGDKTLTEVRREIKRAAVKETAKLPSSKYRVIYADPPWKYGDGLTEAYGAAKFHYPSMSISELCALPVSDLCEDNAALFFWVTSPLLEDAFPIIKAWGFSYKASMVWWKMAHNIGHYVSVQHELLLICTRGSCLPDIPDLLPSVVAIKRKEHSQKPEEFRAIIDKLYPHGRRIELFARKAPAEGWETWGNQA